MSTINTLQYYGTDLDSYGHYFFELEGNRLAKRKTDFGSIPFKPDELLSSSAPKGMVRYAEVEGHAICAIAGSCYDKRGGTKSVFWVKGVVPSNHWKDILLALPIAKRMIDQMPFEVQW